MEKFYHRYKYDSNINNLFANIFYKICFQLLIIQIILLGI